MMQFLSTVCLLGVVLVGLLPMTSAFRLEQAWAVLARGFVAVILIVWAICMVEGLAALVLSALPVALHWIGIVAFVIAGLVIITALIVWLTRRWPKNTEGGDV